MIVGKYLEIWQVGNVEDWLKEKTHRWNVFNIGRGVLLGDIKRFARWRQYCFILTIDETNEGLAYVFSAGCLKDICDFIEKQMAERKAKR